MKKTSIKLNYKFKLITIPIIFFVVIGLLIKFVITPTINDIKDTRLNIIEQELELDRRYNKARALKRMTLKLNKIQPQTKLLKNVFMDLSQELEFITTMEKIAEDNNIDQTMKPGKVNEESNKSTLQSMQVDFTASGKFENLINYLADLEQLNNYINIESIKMSNSMKRKLKSDDTISSEPNIVMVLNTTTYWR